MDKRLTLTKNGYPYDLANETLVKFDTLPSQWALINLNRQLSFVCVYIKNRIFNNGSACCEGIDGCSTVGHIKLYIVVSKLSCNLFPFYSSSDSFIEFFFLLNDIFSICSTRKCFIC